MASARPLDLPPNNPQNLDDMPSRAYDQGGAGQRIMRPVLPLLPVAAVFRGAAAIGSYFDVTVETTSPCSMAD